jgi:voltage-gated potassium channel
MTFFLLRVLRRVRVRRAFGLGLMLALVAFCIAGNAVAFYFFENAATASTPLSFGDALWFSVVSITTIGYGDLSPASLGGRLSTVFFIMLLGLSTFTASMGLLIDAATELISKGKRGMAPISSQGHVLLIHFPAVNRVKQLLDEIDSDPVHQARDTVIVTDQVETLPFTRENVLFVHGSPLEEETYQRANVAQAKMALVLATSYNDPNSDAIAASVVSVLDRMKPELHIVAECLDEKHRMLFASVRCDAVVPVLRIAGNLLVQEIHDPGISQMIDVVTSNLKGMTLFSARVAAGAEDLGYNEVAKANLDRDVNVLCVNRGPETFTAFRSLHPLAGDTVIYLAQSRRTWDDLKAGCGS